GDSDNKLVAGQDVLAARPTLLLALALEGSTPADREELVALLHRTHQETDREKVVARVRQLFTRAQVFLKAEKLVEKYRARAEALAEAVERVELRQLLYSLADSALARAPPATEPDSHPPLLQLTVAQ